MKHRRMLLLPVAVAAMIGVAALARVKEQAYVWQWAKKHSGPNLPVAILIEMGLKDTKPTRWYGEATVRGARIVHREGYRFRGDDRLVAPDSWDVSSHRPIRLPGRNPVLRRMLGIDTVGVVLHLADVQPDATLTVHLRGGMNLRTEIALWSVLAGDPIVIGHQGKAVVRLISAATSIATGPTEDDFPAACYAPDGTLWVAYVSYRLKDEKRRIASSALKQQPESFRFLYRPDFGDQLFVRYYRDGRWSPPAAVTGANEDLVRCAIAAESNGDVWVAYSANRNGNHDIYVRKVDVNTPEAVSHPRPRVGAEQRLTKQPHPDIHPAMATGPNGEVHLVYQRLGPGDDGMESSIWHLYGKNGSWQSTGSLEKPADLSGREWYPGVAAGPDGRLAWCYDVYHQGDADVRALVWHDGRIDRNYGVATTSRFEARPSMCFDRQGRLWIAYEEGPVKWGKDYGALDGEDGNPLYNERSVRVVCIDETGRLMKPVAELPLSRFEAPRIPFNAVKTNRFESGTRYSYPQIGIDGRGRVWLTYRMKFGSRYSSHPGSYWLTFARMLQGDRWSEPIEIHHSDGLMDHRPVLLPHKSGGLVIIHNTDGRYTTPNQIDNQIYMSYVTLPADEKATSPKLVPHEPGQKDKKLLAEAMAERDAVRRIRRYRVDVGGKKYRLLRGEFHRHTEISWDGGADGSLEDMFRYGIDAAAMDWIGNGDHDNGAGREYPWWLTQKFTDAYHVVGAFTPMFTYERSVSYPHGHRNCVFAKRGVMTLPRLAEPDRKKRVAGIHADDTKMLYRYLHELDGVCAVHTSATGMGTDWRDNDPEVEPFVEIYQGDRMSYEYQGCPRAGYDPRSGKEPINIGGWRPAGFVDNAFRKGYRLAFQSSSDHWSTHISYCIVVAERHDRDGILDAMKRRHVYGATDNIIVDVRCGEYMMGDEFSLDGSPKLDFTVIGAKPIRRVDVLKDSQVVHTFEPDRQEFRGTWVDPQPTPGVHYYYIRVTQVDGELAWGSPMWIKIADR